MCCLQSLKKNSKQLLDPVFPAVWLLPSVFHWIALAGVFKGDSLEFSLQPNLRTLSSSFSWLNCQRILLVVLPSLNLTYCISLSTSGRVFPCNKASSFLPPFLLMEQHHCPVCSWGLTLISLVFTSSCIHILLSNIAELNPHPSIHPDTET